MPRRKSSIRPILKRYPIPHRLGDGEFTRGIVNINEFEMDIDVPNTKFSPSISHRSIGLIAKICKFVLGIIIQDSSDNNLQISESW